MQENNKETLALCLTEDLSHNIAVISYHLIVSYIPYSLLVLFYSFYLCILSLHWRQFALVKTMKGCY